MSAILSRSRRRFTVTQFQKMGEAGIFREDERVELIDGEVVAMPPIGSRHAFAVDELAAAFMPALQGTARVSIQNPVVLDEHNQPQPDLMILRLKAAGYRAALPRPEDVLLLVEVSDSTLEYDRGVKLPLYASRGIPEVWILNLRSGLLEIHRDPDPTGYQSWRDVTPAEAVSPGALPAVQIEWGKALG